MFNSAKSRQIAEEIEGLKGQIFTLKHQITEIKTTINAELESLRELVRDLDYELTDVKSNLKIRQTFEKVIK